MLKEADFENLVWDLLLTYRQLLLNGFLHKRVNTEAYNKNHQTWDTLLLSLEAGVVLGLAKLLEEKSCLGRGFNDENLDRIAKKVTDLRNAFIAHNDLSKMRSKRSFLEENQLTGTDLVQMIDTLKKRAIAYQEAYKLTPTVQSLFEETTRGAATDLDGWLKSFTNPL